jgi:hypothetical protein
MKLTRKITPPKGLLSEAPSDSPHETSPNLFIHQLPKEIEGMPESGPFEAHIKGHVRRHSMTTETSDDNKKGTTHHSYDCDIHELEPTGKKGAKQKESTREGVDRAFRKMDEEDEEKKAKK